MSNKYSLNIAFSLCPNNLLLLLLLTCFETMASSLVLISPPPSLNRKLIDADAEILAEFKWDRKECVFRDAVGQHWLILALDTWNGDGCASRLKSLYGDDTVAILVKMTSEATRLV